MDQLWNEGVCQPEQTLRHIKLLNRRAVLNVTAVSEQKRQASSLRLEVRVELTIV